MTMLIPVASEMRRRPAGWRPIPMVVVSTMERPPAAVNERSSSAARTSSSNAE